MPDLVAVAGVLLAVLFAALLLRGEPDAYPVGDGAVLEIGDIGVYQRALTSGQ